MVQLNEPDQNGLQFVLRTSTSQIALDDDKAQKILDSGEISDAVKEKMSARPGHWSNFD